MKYKLLVLWTLCFSSSLAQVKTIVCYLQGTSFDGSFSLEGKKDNPCTHIIYSKATFNLQSGTVEIDQRHEDGLDQLLEYRAEGGMDFKILIQIGNAYDGEIYSKLTSNPANRSQLISSIIGVTNEYGLDGVDLHWMYPGNKAQEKQNYLSLGQELKKAFQEEADQNNSVQKLISMVLPKDKLFIQQGYNIIELQSRVVDFFCLPPFDFKTSDSPLEDHHSPITSMKSSTGGETYRENSVEHMVKLYVRVGLLPRKLVLGIPLFGRKYILAQDNATVIENGKDFVPFDQICNLNQKGWTVWTNAQKGKFAYKDGQVISYDDEEVIADKVKLAVKYNLGGIMFWSMDMDDSNQTCPTHNGKENKSGWLLIDSATETWIEEQAVASYGVQLENHDSGSDLSVNPIDKDSANRVVPANSNEASTTFAPVEIAAYGAPVANWPTQKEPIKRPVEAKPASHASSSYSNAHGPEDRPNSPWGKAPWDKFFPESLLDGVRVIEAAKDIVLEDTQIHFNENNYYRSPPRRTSR